MIEHPAAAKIGVDETVEAWFDLKGTELIVKRVTFQKNGEERRWP